ncbi:2935_t:CDS:2 [Ambispora gerdemannii]|uniref:2935_t:CDS:1 n=1 Tax=Ambispora gerdemannii TaxID=144530 RepID=A0A9N8V2R3_9GLOM|nr:2935_t:CDS:2 [Ambispora gerdemannii]
MPGTIREISESLSSTNEPPQFPQLTEQHVLNCTFSAWYDTFRRVTLKSQIIKPLPAEFVEYLQADSVYLPEYNSLGRGYIREEPLPSFPELENQIWDIINKFDGAVFPKLNWSSPKDATWIAATNTLKCNSPSDIFLLLKGSDFIAHDLDHAFDNCQYESDEAARRKHPEAYELVLRKWYDVATSMEFRCFVKSNELIGISQRDVNFYPFLFDIKEELQSKITQFFILNIQHKFANNDYVFDVYITRNRERVWLIDFNLFNHTTDSLLYSWDEIVRGMPINQSISRSNLTLKAILVVFINHIEHKVAMTQLDMRLIGTQAEASQSRNQPFSVNRYPREMFDFSQGQTVAEFAERFQRELVLAENNESDQESTEYVNS